MPTPAIHPDEILFHLAFDNSAQPTIISIISTGKILMANAAACKLLGYTKKELLTRTRSMIFAIKDSRFKNIMKASSPEDNAVTTTHVICKTGKTIVCEITFAVFTGAHGIRKSITSLHDLTASIHRQQLIDIKKDKIVSANIDMAKLTAKASAEKKEKKVAEDIATAIGRQKAIDAENSRTVADNIKIARDASDAKMSASNAWIKQIAQTSYDVMWDWNILTGNVYIGDSIEEVFGYQLKNNTVVFGEFKKIVLTNDAPTVLRKLMKVLKSADKSWSDSFSVKRSDGTFANVNSRGSIVRDVKGKAIRMIGATQDISKLQELQKGSSVHPSIKKGNDDMFHLAAKLSYDGIWDWNILTNEFFLGEGFEHLFGYQFTKENNQGFNWSQFLHPEDKAAVEKGFEDAIASGKMSWEHGYRFIKADGTVANVYGRASIIRDEKGQAVRMIGVIHDLSRQHELEEKLQKEILSAGRLHLEYKENLRMLFNSTSDVLYDIDLVTDEIILSEGYEKEFGYPITPHMKTEDVWGMHLHPEDSQHVWKDYQRMLLSNETSWKYQYRFIKADNSIANIISSRIVLRHADGKAYRMIGSMQDISKQTVLEAKLEREISLKEKQINDAMQDANESARSEIGKELHDNVNQLLGVSRLYLEMAKQGGNNSEAHLARSSEYTQNAIEAIRKLSKGLSTDSIQLLGLCYSIENLAEVAMEINPVTITCSLDPLVENRLHDKFKLNIYRIIQEQLNNIMKHAKAAHVCIVLSQNKRTVILTIEDDGIGFNTAKRNKGVGVDNINSRAAAFNGRACFVSAPGKGCTLTITFMVNDSLLTKK